MLLPASCSLVQSVATSDTTSTGCGLERRSSRSDFSYSSAASAADTREPSREESTLTCCSVTESAMHAAKKQHATTQPAKLGVGSRTHESR